METPNTRIVRVGLGDRAYDVRIGPGLLAELGPAVKAVAPALKAILVSDSNVSLHYNQPCVRSLRDAGYEVVRVTIPAGESSKSFEQLRNLWDLALEAKIDRKTPLIALGGGVVGDLGGFAAATLLRGIPFIQAPTSLEAAVDASVGGKTAINHPRGKNLIGAFHQPRLVLHDTQALATLPRRDLHSALAESVKHAILADPDFFTWHEQHADVLAGPWNERWAELAGELVERNVAIKARVVEEDEREAGLRAVLNLGHTVGHALEAWSLHNQEEASVTSMATTSVADLWSGPLRHGEGVALGMAAAVRLARAREALSSEDAWRILDLMQKLGLPTQLPDTITIAPLHDLIEQDKKMSAGKLTFVLPTAIGKVDLVRDVTANELTAAIQSLMTQP